MLRIFKAQGLNIGSRYLASVGLSTGNGRYLVKDRKVLRLPDGLVRPSPIDLNIKDYGKLRETIQQFLLNPKNRMKKKIFLGLPDLSVKVSIVDLEKLPSGKKDLEKILAWKMEKASLFPLHDVKLSYQVLHKPTKRDGGSYRLLVSMIKRDILIQYEDLISSLGLWPVIVDISSFHIFNLYNDYISQRISQEKGFIFLNIFENFTLMIFKDGLLDYIRIKASGGGPAKTFDEILTSLNIYSEGHDLSAITHLFVFGDTLSEEFAKRAEKELGLIAESLGPKMVSRVEGITSIIDEDNAPLIPALAAAIGR